MSDENQNVLFQIGQMTGQLSALISNVVSLQAVVNSLDQRLREQEKASARMAAIIGLVGVMAGGAGHFIMDLLRPHL